MKKPPMFLFFACVLFAVFVLPLKAFAIDDEAMVHVPAGWFQMGCNKNTDPDCFESEMPAHGVWLDGFWIDKYEVTFQRYEACVAAGKCEPLGVGGGCNYLWPGSELKPVNCVTWYNARQMCRWEGKQLPTEAQWEKAARANTQSLYPWGNKKPNCKLADMDSANGGNLACGKGSPGNVGSKPKGASPYGAMDMAGSMWEWTNDWYEHFYYYRSPLINPKGPNMWHQNNTMLKTARGGDIYARKAEELRSVTRFPYAPENYSPAVGFRCAM